ncbi:uncharacterized protein V1513DRAFT_437980 [Lipomyces chichibuensis]|uniref:uncharacterized protein n=1 Tax=Lipomyces chichibuensis TaxID=1546026 RepID=UPI0033440B8C
MKPPDDFKLALAIAIVRAKPADVDIFDYRLRVLERIDRAEFWKTRYDDTIREVRNLREQVDLLKADISKKRKRNDQAQNEKDRKKIATVQAESVVPKESLSSPSSVTILPQPAILTTAEHNEESIGQSIRQSNKLNTSSGVVKSDNFLACYGPVFTSDILRESTRILLTNGYASAEHVIEHIHVLKLYIAPSDDDPEKVLSPVYVVEILGFIIFCLEQVAFRTVYSMDGRECEGTGEIKKRIKFQECLTCLLRCLLHGIAVFSRREVYNRSEGYESKCASDGTLDTLLAAYARVILSTAARSPGLRKGIINLVLEHLKILLSDPHSLLFGFSTRPSTTANPLREEAASNTAKRYLFLLQYMTPHETVSEHATMSYDIESVLFAENGVGESTLGVDGFRKVVRSYCLLSWKDEW